MYLCVCVGVYGCNYGCVGCRYVLVGVPMCAYASI